jgi:hypothetical protein
MTHDFKEIGADVESNATLQSLRDKVTAFLTGQRPRVHACVSFPFGGNVRAKGCEWLYDLAARRARLQDLARVETDNCARVQRGNPTPLPSATHR